MASTSSNLFQSLSIQSVHNAPPTSGKPHAPKHAQIPTRVASLGGRRQWLLLLTATTTTLKAMELPSRAEDIGLFGLRTKLKKVEEEAEEIVKEGFETVDKGIEAAVSGIEAAEKGAEDIGLFGLRKKLKKVEEEAEEIVKEGFESVDKGIVAAEKGVEAAEEEIQTVLSFGGLAQAGVVAGAEVVGVLLATSVVNGILGPEGQKS